MKKLAVLIVVLASHARADSDLTVLAFELRDAFGTGISHCSATECHTDLGTVWCNDTMCSAIDHLANDRSVVATGPRARQTSAAIRLTPGGRRRGVWSAVRCRMTATGTARSS
jgi:hypothetical protein